MSKEILMLASDTELTEEVQKALKDKKINMVMANSLNDLEKALKGTDIEVLVLDLDTVDIENRFIRNLKKQQPAMTIIGLSDRSFHPELKEAMRKHIYACLCKPIDPDELVYWINSIVENGVDSQNMPP
jgi:DNA-binding NtrC family response regulator